MCQMRFGSKWLLFMFTYAPIIFHCVTLCARMSRRRFASHKDPSQYLVQRFLASLRPTRPNAATEVRQRRGWLNQTPIAVLIEWLDFSSDIKAVDNSTRVLFKAARIIAKRTQRSVPEVLGQCRGIGGTTLRRARVKLDSVAMLLYRMLFRCLPDLISIYMYIDSSPQLMGCEMFAASFEVFDPTGQLPFERKLMPIIYLSREYLDVAGKTLASIWVIFLLVGPDYATVSKFCSRVVAICTDMGTERLIARATNMLPDFYDLILNVKIPAAPPHCTYLFPFAVQAPGWNHGWDIVLKRGLASLSWFPAFLDRLRCLVHFFRTRILVEALARKVSESYPVISELIQGVHVVGIAAWRWGTLHTAVSSLDKVIATLAVHWDESLFANAKDPVTLKKASKALASATFRWQFKFVVFFCDWICRIQAWGKGCAALERAKATGTEHLLTDRDRMQCGRRLHEAECYVQAELNRGLREANGWTAESFGFGCSFLDIDALKVCCRASFALAQKRHTYLGLCPWLLARLDEPGIKRRCEEQYASHQGHHPLTFYFLAPDGPLRPHVDLIQPDGSGCSELLVHWLKILKHIPFDDSIAEGPHAIGNRLSSHGRNTGYVWQASSMRLNQNITDARQYSMALKCDLQQLWNSHSSVLQTRPKALHRPLRIAPKLYQDLRLLWPSIQGLSVQALKRPWHWHWPWPLTAPTRPTRVAKAKNP